jgi:hypothetical protein
MSATISSTPSAAAMKLSPGRVTVHCWSRLRSRWLFVAATMSLQK